MLGWIKKLPVKINKITNRQVAIVLAVLGFIVFCIGLKNPFQGDDILQIVSNLPVHSIANVRLFFEGGTYYKGGGLTPLGGIYYRPLLSTVYSLIYSIFGPHTWAFHLLQLTLYVSSAFLLYLVFRRFLKSGMALFLSLVFLVHPMNSQTVFAISSMQEVLFFFFGILGLWFLLRDDTTKNLRYVVLCFFFALLSKETAIVFVVMALAYLFWFNRKRLYSFIYYIALPLLIYIVLKVDAVGIHGRSHAGPIDNLTIYGRLMTDPSIILFYLTKFIFPWKLASSYYWTYPHFSITHFLLPLFIDLAVVGAFIYLGFRVQDKLKKAQYHTYLFFAVWTAAGLIPNLQVVPLGLTASESWFYFSMAGLLGMIGIILIAYPIRLKREWLLLIAVVLIALLGVRTVFRGRDWSNPTNLAYKDVSAAPNNYYAENIIAGNLINQGKYSEARYYAARSVVAFPEYNNYFAYAVASGYLGNYTDAASAYVRSLDYSTDNKASIDQLGELTMVSGTPQADYSYLTSALKVYPHDSSLWMYLSVLEYRLGYESDAKVAISNAVNYGQVPQFIYQGIVNNNRIYISLPDLNKRIEV